MCEILHNKKLNRCLIHMYAHTYVCTCTHTDARAAVLSGLDVTLPQMTNNHSTCRSLCPLRVVLWEAAVLSQRHSQ